MTKKPDAYIIGEIVAVIEHKFAMPHTMVAKIQIDPLGKLPYWLNVAKDDSDIIDLIFQIADDDLNHQLRTAKEQGQYYIGYYQRKQQIWNNNKCDIMKELVFQYRRKTGETQEEFAKRAGVSPRTLASVELGEPVKDSSLDLILRCMQ